MNVGIRVALGVRPRDVGIQDGEDCRNVAAREVGVGLLEECAVSVGGVLRERGSAQAESQEGEKKWAPHGFVGLIERMGWTADGIKLAWRQKE